MIPDKQKFQTHKVKTAAGLPFQTDRSIASHLRWWYWLINPRQRSSLSSSPANSTRKGREHNIKYLVYWDLRLMLLILRWVYVCVSVCRWVLSVVRVCVSVWFQWAAQGSGSRKQGHDLRLNKWIAAQFRSCTRLLSQPTRAEGLGGDIWHHHPIVNPLWVHSPWAELVWETPPLGQSAGERFKGVTKGEKTNIYLGMDWFVYKSA